MTPWYLNTPWYVPVFLSLVIGDGLQQIFIKKVAGQHSKTTRFIIMYAISALLAAILGLATGNVRLDFAALVIIGIGFFNALATYAHWVAVDISLSKASIYLILDNLLAMALSYIILSEGRFLTLWLSIGIALSLISAIFFPIWKKINGGKTKSGVQKEIKLLICVFIFSIVWGGAIFSMRYFGVQGFAPLRFVWSWYLGSFIGSAVIFLLNRGPKNWIGLKDIGQITILSVCMLASLGTYYWAVMLSPQVAVQPIFMTMEMILPTILGLYMFKEIKELDGVEKSILVVGGIGAIIISMNL